MVFEADSDLMPNANGRILEFNKHDIYMCFIVVPEGVYSNGSTGINFITEYYV